MLKYGYIVATIIYSFYFKLGLSLFEPYIAIKGQTLFMQQYIDCTYNYVKSKIIFATQYTFLCLV